MISLSLWYVYDIYMISYLIILYGGWIRYGVLLLGLQELIIVIAGWVPIWSQLGSRKLVMYTGWIFGLKMVEIFMWWNTLQKILRISSKVDQFRREDLSFGMPIVYVTRFVSDGSLDLFQFTWKVEPAFLGLEEPDCERKLWRYMKILQITEQRNEGVLPSGNWT
jgi:hypothetical protein